MLKSTPHILEVSLKEGRAQFELLIDGDLIYFDGHFDQYPVLPGVVLLSWVSQLAAEHLNTSPLSRGLENIKFLKPVIPRMRVKLELVSLIEKRAIEFTYSSGEEKISSGRLLLGEV